MTGLPEGYRAIVFGASGGIGAALCDQLAADPRCGALYCASRTPHRPGPGVALSYDLTTPETIGAALQAADDGQGLHLVLVATGILSTQAGDGPERSWRTLNRDVMAELFEVNTILPSLIAAEALGLLSDTSKRSGVKTQFAALSARVGSISDNRLGGWYSYRASKAGLNQILRTLSIELARKAPEAVCVGLHPGTVDTGLSRPFQRGVPAGQLFTPARSAQQLLSVLNGLTPADSGRVFDWAGEEVAP